jgi:hypothetical protein
MAAVSCLTCVLEYPFGASTTVAASLLVRGPDAYM